MKPIYLCVLLTALSACTPARYNNNPTLSKSAESVKTKQKLENTAILQGFVWKTLQAARSDKLGSELTYDMLSIIATFAKEGALKKSTQDVADQLFIKCSKNTLSKPELIKGLESILHDIENVTGVILKPQFEEFGQRLYDQKL